MSDPHRRAMPGKDPVLKAGRLLLGMANARNRKSMEDLQILLEIAATGCSKQDLALAAAVLIDEAASVSDDDDLLEGMALRCAYHQAGGDPHDLL